MYRSSDSVKEVRCRGPLNDDGGSAMIEQTKIIEAYGGYGIEGDNGV